MSVTDRCDFRCEYCMAENMTFLPKDLFFTGDRKICVSFIKLALKIRITGGEPLVRKNVMIYLIIWRIVKKTIKDLL